MTASWSRKSAGGQRRPKAVSKAVSKNSHFWSQNFPMAHFIEVSHPVVDGMKTYPGLPEPRVEIVFDYEMSHERYQGKAEFRIASLHLCDDTADLSRPAHTKLLGAGIPVCEHMTNLAAVPPSGGRLHAVPIAWVGGASFPVRAYVIV